MYKYALSLMLKYNDYIAAIIPDSFINSKEFKERLHTVISIDKRIFKDTKHPVCLALFTPIKTNDFKVCFGDKYIGYYNKDIKSKIPNAPKQEWTLNNKEGKFLLKSYDRTTCDDIHFYISDDFPKSTHLIYVIDTPLNIKDINKFIEIGNQVINKLRKDTDDIIFTTKWKLRVDGKYLRQISKTLARKVLDETYRIYKEISNEE